MNPFQPPAVPHHDDKLRRPGEGVFSTMLAPVLWGMIALKLVVVVITLAPFINDFGFQLPWIAQAFLHPTSALACTCVAGMLTINHLSSRPRRDRQTVASIGTFLGVVVLTLCLVAFGMILSSFVFDLEITT